MVKNAFTKYVLSELSNGNDSAVGYLPMLQRQGKVTPALARQALRKCLENQLVEYRSWNQGCYSGAYDYRIEEITGDGLWVKGLLTQLNNNEKVNYRGVAFNPIETGRPPKRVVVPYDFDKKFYIHSEDSELDEPSYILILRYQGASFEKIASEVNRICHKNKKVRTPAGIMQAFYKFDKEVTKQREYDDPIERKPKRKNNTLKIKGKSK